jgi:phage baseplate assembly protein W
MGFVFETITKTDIQPDVALGVKISNANSIFKSVYTIADQTKENLKSLILTRIGERYMLPEFGTNLLNMLFEPISYEFNDGVSTSITSAIERWLPYVVIENLNVVTVLDDPTLQHMVEISLTYSVQNFNTNSIKIFASETGNITVV